MWNIYYQETVDTSGFATTQVVVSVRHPITQSPTNLAYTLKIHTGENEINKGC